MGSLLAGALAGVCSLPAVGGMIDDFSDATAPTTSAAYTAGSMFGGERDALVGGSPAPSFDANELATFRRKKLRSTSCLAVVRETMAILGLRVGTAQAARWTPEIKLGPPKQTVVTVSSLRKR